MPGLYNINIKFINKINDNQFALYMCRGQNHIRSIYEYCRSVDGVSNTAMFVYCTNCKFVSYKCSGPFV